MQSNRQQALGKIAGGIAHEFNNQLTAIAGNAELLAMLSDNSETLRPHVEAIAAAVAKASKLTGHLLSYAGRQHLQAAPVSPGAFLTDHQVILKSALRAPNRIHLDIGIPQDDWHILLDAQQLEVALVNLLSNARQAMPAGGRVAVEALNFSAGDPRLPAELQCERDHVAFVVRDEGDGMDRDTAKQATEPFFSTRGVGAGVGLGLSMVAGFVRQSQGYMRLSTQARKGTEVSMIFPRHVGAPRKDRAD
nr:ATP-binding protein [Thetidibacter halocola]